MTSRARLEKIGISIPEILLPGSTISKETWSVIACDQFSSERSYWENTKHIVGAAASTLELIIPECYLEDGDREERADAANAAMADYLERGVLQPLPPGFILVNRQTPHAESRKGLVLAVDLEAYDFAEGSTSRIRPTEGTIRDRLPPRMAVRRGAVLDLPHILLLIDDPENRVINAASAAASSASTSVDDTVYDFKLMQDGGRISGRHVPEEFMEPLVAAFENLASESNLLFAVGDGNHSLATAKEIWKEKKADAASAHHPARYALVEVENIHDPGLHFHPIHRVIFNTDPEELIVYLKNALGADEKKSTDAGSDVRSAMIEIVSLGGAESALSFTLPLGRLAVEPLQEALDAYLDSHPNSDIDYIHGADSVRELVSADHRRLGIILPDLDKSTFFQRIEKIGPYPRKTFSIGEAVEKRYYLESRRI